MPRVSRKGRMREDRRGLGSRLSRGRRARRLLGPAERVVRDEYKFKKGHVMRDRIAVLRMLA
jgi:hypothetical protein